MKNMTLVNRRRRLREARLARTDQVVKKLSVRPGKASRFIHHLKRYHRRHPHLAVVLYLRVSSGPQGYRGNLDTYEWKLRLVCKKLRIPVVAVFCDVVSGWVLSESRDCLIAAVECARQYEARTGVHTAVLAPSTDRFIRSADYNSKTNPDVMPTKAEFRRLSGLTGGIPLLTYLRPDMSPGDVRSRQTKWGQQYKNRKGGRPKKPGWCKQRRERLQPKARRLREKGWHYRAIAERLGVSLRTAWEWAKEG